MKKIVLMSVIAIALVPALSFADNDDRRSPMGSDAMVGSGMTHDMREYARSPMGSGAMMGSGMKMGSGEMMKRNMEALHEAMKKLTPEQHAELLKMVRTYLESKGIQVPTPSEKKAEIKDMRDAMKDTAKTLRKRTQEEIKAQRDIMKGKIQALRGKKD